MNCRQCDQREIWILDCDVGVECPQGIDNHGCHYHYLCGRCGYQEIRHYIDDSSVTGQDAVQRFYERLS